MRLRRGQAMVESVVAVLFVAFLFFVLFFLSRLLTVKIMLEYSASRVARARTVGLNDFVCEKAARVSVMTVAGRRLWPDEEELAEEEESDKDPEADAEVEEFEELGEEFEEKLRYSAASLVQLARLYMGRETPAEAAGFMEYEYWQTLYVEPGDVSKVRMKFKIWDIPVSLEGESHIENHYRDYLAAP